MDVKHKFLEPKYSERMNVCIKIIGIFGVSMENFVKFKSIYQFWIDLDPNIMLSMDIKTFEKYLNL